MKHNCLIRKGIKEGLPTDATVGRGSSVEARCIRGESLLDQGTHSTTGNVIVTDESPEETEG